MKQSYKEKNRKSSLVVVGTGIKTISHLTAEAKVYIEQSEKVLYLVNNPIIKEWIHQINLKSESLDPLYFKFKARLKNYKNITAYILQFLKRQHHLCVVIYGHPTVFAQPALDAVIKAKKLGYDARVLPGISSEDCLFADLLIDPGTTGCQSWDATDFLIHCRKVDPTSLLVLWQIGVIGQVTNSRIIDTKKGLGLLVEYLLEYYSKEQEIIVYEAAQFPGLDAYIKRIKLSDLIDENLTKLSTLCIQPSKRAFYNVKIIKALGLSLKDFN